MLSSTHTHQHTRTCKIRCPATKINDPAGTDLEANCTFEEPVDDEEANTALKLDNGSKFVYVSIIHAIFHSHHVFVSRMSRWAAHRCGRSAIWSQVSSS